MTKGEKISRKARERAKYSAGRRAIAAALAAETGECIIWPLAIHHRGYGVTAIERVSIGAHQVVCAMAHGDKPFPGAVVRHSCRTPACVNPRHLSWGTAQDNSDDREAHGMTPRGEHAGPSKLTTDQVREIKASDRAVSHTELAQRFGVSISNISQIRRAKTWRHVA